MWCMLLDRPQQVLRLISIPLDHFVESLPNGSSLAEDESTVSHDSGPEFTQLIYKTSDTWINVCFSCFLYYQLIKLVKLNMTKNSPVVISLKWEDFVIQVEM